MTRFVILEHDWPEHHYDLMIEAGSVLRTWRLTALPSADQPTFAESIGNHRRAYLDYEGPISVGRGSVKRIDSGTFEIVDECDNRVVLDLLGNRIRGQFEFKW